MLNRRADPRRAFVHLVAWTAAIVLVAALAFVLYWSLATLGSRPPMAGETEELFEAARIRAHLPLYIDPIAGSHDYGSLPVHYFVTYPPLWSFALSLVPSGAVTVVARLLSALAWVGGLALLAVRAPRACRVQALVAAGFYAGVLNLAFFAHSGRPDSVAVLFVAIALHRATRDGRVGLLSGALFALGAWWKPTVLGAAAGALAVQFATPRRSRAALAGVAVTSAVVLGALTVISGNAWFTHLVRSNLQPFSASQWATFVAHDAFFFLGPILYAGSLAWSRRSDPGVAIAAGALAGSLGWALVCLAKTGAATNYWMESAVAVVALCARVPPPRLTQRPGLAALALGQALWVGGASISSVLYWAPADGRIDALLKGARAACRAASSDFVMSDDPGAELLLDGRIYTTAYQMVFLVLRGRFPAATWADDIARPDVTCFVEHSGIMRRVPELARVLDAKFEVAASTDGWTVLRMRR